MDPQSQEAFNRFAGLGAGVVLFFILFGLAVYAFITWLYWRCFVKAGLSGPLALLNLLYPIGPLICLCILAFSNWKVVPAAVQYTGMTPYPPPGYPPSGPPAPPSYPPSGYPPQGPTA